MSLRQTDSLSLDVFPVLRLLDVRVVLILVVQETLVLLSTIAVLIDILTNSGKSSAFSTFLSTLFGFHILDNSHSNWGEVTFHHGFD